MGKHIKIFDTTLRDGEQTPGVNLNIKEKVLIAKQLELLNVDVIEAGFPVSSDNDFKAVKEIAETLENTTVVALARTIKGDIDSAYAALKNAKKPRLHIFIATSEVHMKYKLNMTKEEVLERAISMTRYAKTLFDEIEFSAEDASRSDPDFLCDIFQCERIFL